MAYWKVMGADSYDKFWNEVFSEILSVFEISEAELRETFYTCASLESYRIYLQTLREWGEVDFIVNALSSFDKVSSAIISQIDRYIKVKECFDFGAGFGLSTMYYAKLQPEARFFFYDKNEQFMLVFKKLCSKFNIRNVTFSEPESCIDTVLCLEVIEHTYDPTQVITKLCDLSAQYFVLSSRATAAAPGHFKSYMFNGKSVPNRRLKWTVREYLKDRGFIEMRRGWNNSYYLYEKNNV